MSEVKVNKITPTTNCGTVTLGDSGDTIAIPAGVNLTSGGALTNSGTITNTGSITGVAITGTIDNQVNWQTTVKTTGFTAVAGEGYFCNTTSAAFTVTLPASPSAGDLIGIKDYANTADTNNITIGRNGSNIEGVANDFVINVEGGSITLIYVDATKGWLSTAAAKASDITEGPAFIVATGGTETTCGDYKIHTFTGPGDFCVSQAGNPIGSDSVDYLVVAGGGAGGGCYGSGAAGAGGGAGGYRTSFPSGTAITATVASFPITVGAGGTAVASPSPDQSGNPGSNSVFSTITSAGGGGGGEGYRSGTVNGKSGGSGGGAGSSNGFPTTLGSGNTPPTSPPQGNNGGSSYPGDPIFSGGGGGGASAVGTNGASPGGGAGGAGSANSITGSSITRAGGGGGAGKCAPSGAGGSGGGGAGGTATNGTSGTANTGGGGGGAAHPGARQGGSGGSGIVIIRYKFQ